MHPLNPKVSLLSFRLPEMFEKPLFEQGFIERVEKSNDSYMLTNDGKQAKRIGNIKKIKNLLDKEPLTRIRESWMKRNQRPIIFIPLLLAIIQAISPFCTKPNLEKQQNKQQQYQNYPIKRIHQQANSQLNKLIKHQ